MRALSAQQLQQQLITLVPRRLIRMPAPPPEEQTHLAQFMTCTLVEPLLVGSLERIGRPTLLAEALDDLYDSVPRTMMSLRAEAKNLEMSRRTFTAKVLDVAAATFSGVQCYLGSFASKLRKEIAAGRAEGLVFNTVQLYDETPLIVRSRDAVEDGDSAGPTKLMQIECCLSMTLRNVATKAVTLFTVPHIPTPVIPMETANAESIHEVMQVRLKLQALLKSLQDLFGIVVTTSICDSAKSNLRYEAYMARKSNCLVILPELPVRMLLRLRIPCDIPAISRAGTRSYLPISTDISGLIATCLTARNCGGLWHLRSAMRDVVKGSLEIVRGPPPGPDSHQARARDLLLGACLEHKGDDVLRKCRLQHVLTSDVHSDSITFYTLDPRVTDDSYPAELVRVLLPSLNMLARSRWLTTTYPLRQIALVDSVNGLFRRAVPLWIKKSKNNVSKAAANTKLRKAHRWLHSHRIRTLIEY